MLTNEDTQSGWKRIDLMTMGALSFAVVFLLLALPWFDALPDYLYVLVVALSPFMIVIIACVIRLSPLPTDDGHFLFYFILYLGAIFNLFVALSKLVLMLIPVATLTPLPRTNRRMGTKYQP